VVYKSALCVILIHFLPYPLFNFTKAALFPQYPPFSIKSASFFYKSAPFSAFYKTNPPLDFNKSAFIIQIRLYFNISASLFQHIRPFFYSALSISALLFYKSALPFFFIRPFHFYKSALYIRPFIRPFLSALFFA
jgi:hypothetical protein